MGRSNVKVDFSEIKKAAEQLAEAQTKLFLETVANEIALRYMGKAVKKTPVDTGKLKKSWNISVNSKGNGYEIILKNSEEYASYVEYGHRQEPGRYVPELGKALKASWVDGQFFLKKSEVEMERELPGIVERKIGKWLKEVLG